MSKYVCQICGFTYDEDAGMPDKGIPSGTKWEQLPADWTCPICGSPKAAFTKQDEVKVIVQEKKDSKVQDSPTSFGSPDEKLMDDLRKMSKGELSALFSNLAKGCEKQYKAEEASLFTKIADYYKKSSDGEKGNFDDLTRKINQNIADFIPDAKSDAERVNDRGARRVLTWSEKATLMMSAILERYKKEGNAILENTKIWVCDICGFIYIGDVPPTVCPICKVPSFKILEVA